MLTQYKYFSHNFLLCHSLLARLMFPYSQRQIIRFNGKMIDVVSFVSTIRVVVLRPLYVTQYGDFFFVCVFVYLKGRWAVVYVHTTRCCHNKDKNSTEMEPARVCSMNVRVKWTREYFTRVKTTTILQCMFWRVAGGWHEWWWHETNCCGICFFLICSYVAFVCCMSTKFRWKRILPSSCFILHW